MDSGIAFLREQVRRCFWCSAGVVEIGRADAAHRESRHGAVVGLGFVDFAVREPVFLDKGCARAHAARQPIGT
jgi:hypothetical protein